MYTQNDAGHFLLGAVGQDVAQRLDDPAALDVPGELGVERQAPGMEWKADFVWLILFEKNRVFRI